MKVSQALNISRLLRRICEKGGVREERRILDFELGIFESKGEGSIGSEHDISAPFPCGLIELKEA